MKNTYRMIHLIPLLFSIAFLLLRTVPTIFSGQFTFAFDMGRDLLWVRNMVELRKPTLIGPWGSIAGVYFGPLWFYLLSIPYVLFNGDPRSAVLVPLVSNIATLCIGWWWLRKEKHPVAANIWAVLYGFSPLVISISEFPFHANLLPLVTLLFLIGLSEWSNVSKHLLLWPLPLAALMASIAYHLEPAAGVMLTVIFGCTLIFNLLKISWYTRTPHLRPSDAWMKTTGGSKRSAGAFHLFIYSFIAFSLPFIPQMVFEFRHDFIQTKALVSYFRGENESLGGVLPLKERVPERVTKFARTLSQSVLPLDEDWQKWVLLGAFGILGIFVMKQKSDDGFTSRFTLHAFFLILFHYFFYTFLFPAELKNWYLFGFASVYLLAIALIVEARIRSFERSDPSHSVSVFNKLLTFFFFAIWFWRTVDPVARIRSQPVAQAAPETLRAQLEVVDWIYQDATSNGKPFSVYTYTPPIYDYTYQYLLWWRGREKYQILPAEFSYQPSETSYLPEKGKFVSSQWKPEDAETIYLILEPDSIESRREGWLGHFASLQALDDFDFSSGVKVEIRQRTSIIDL